MSSAHSPRANGLRESCQDVPKPLGQMPGNVPAAPPRRPAVSPDVPECPRVSHALQKCGTKPPLDPLAAWSPNPLNHRQLAAARLVVRGHRTGNIAEHLGIDRRTLLRWRLMPAFAAEV